MVTQYLEQRADLVAAFDRVPQWLVGADAIDVAPALPNAIQITGLDEIADDALGCSFGDTDPFGHIA